MIGMMHSLREQIRRDARVIGWKRRGITITLDQYDALLIQQDRRCAICRRLPTTRALNVDHDHKSGTVRGLLCFRCNRYLIHFWRGPTAIQLFKRAAKYLERADGA